MTIHSENPFLDPDPDPVRRLRGRLGGGVTLWTAGEGDERAGLTVSSLMVAIGEPDFVLALVDPDSDLGERLTETGAAVVHLLQWPDLALADAFAGMTPAPGGPFRLASWEQTEWGPRKVPAHTWAGVRLVDSRPMGWANLVTCEVQQVGVADDDEPLIHRRGRYQRP